MTNALTWLNDLAQWLGRWIPRLILIEPTHRGVLFGPRGSARLAGPGLVVYWPITHALVQIAVTTQSIQLMSQVFPIDDNDAALIPRVHLCAAAIQIRVHDAVLAATKALHLFALVDNRAQATIARHQNRHSGLQEWAANVAIELMTELEPYGVTVERLDFTGYGKGVALKNLADWSYSDGVDGKRPTQ